MNVLRAGAPFLLCVTLFGACSDETVVEASLVECCTDASCQAESAELASCQLARCDVDACTCEVVAADDGTPCEDGQQCTSADVCVAGECQGGEDVCECVSDDDCAGQGDGDACNGTLVCDTENFPNRCVVDPETVVECDGSGDGPCSSTQCNPSTGACEEVPRDNGEPCDDGGECTSADTCHEARF